MYIIYIDENLETAFFFTRVSEAPFGREVLVVVEERAMCDLCLVLFLFFTADWP
jgi:hypothetical protein